MSVKELASITTISDLLDYIEVERAEANKYCTKVNTLAAYQAAYDYIDGLDQISAATLQAGGGVSAYIANGVGMIKAARAQWTADGCKKPGSSSTGTPDDSTTLDAAGSGVGFWLLVAGAGLLMYLLAKR